MCVYKQLFNLKYIEIKYTQKRSTDLNNKKK